MFLTWIRNKMGAISTGNDWTADEITDLSGKVRSKEAIEWRR
jgi:hypothetical protein